MIFGASGINAFTMSPPYVKQFTTLIYRQLSTSLQYEHWQIAFKFGAMRICKIKVLFMIACKLFLANEENPSINYFYPIPGWIGYDKFKQVKNESKF